MEKVIRLLVEKASFFIICRSGDKVPLLCIDNHPTQPHILATGSQDGVLSIWDVRQDNYPVTLLEGHSAECKFVVCK